MIAQKGLKIGSIIVLILGIIHCCATPLIIPSLSVLKTPQLLTCSFMFVCSGIAVIFIGWLQYYILRQIGIHSGFLRILKVSIALMLIIGVGSVATMWNNPFAYIILFAALFEFICFRFMNRGIQIKSMTFC